MKYPWFRDELLHHLNSLSDLNYQKECWVKNNYPDGIKYDKFDAVVHFLFDDMTLNEDPESAIGILLRNKNEALAVKEVCDKIDIVLDEHCGSTDEEYIATEEWKYVISSAQKALEVFNKSEDDAPSS